MEIKRFIVTSKETGAVVAAVYAETIQDQGTDGVNFMIGEIPVAWADTNLSNVSESGKAKDWPTHLVSSAEVVPYTCMMSGRNQL
jgi:hypothetical protein